MRKYISFIIVALLLFVLSGTLAQAQIFKSTTLDSITGGPLGTSKGGMGTTNTTTFLNSIMSPSGQNGKIWGSNGTTGGWVSATDPGCTGCATTEAADISGVTIAADTNLVTAGNDNDDGNALRVWINAHPSNQIIHFTPGVYKFETWAAVNNTSNIEIKCDVGATFIKDPIMDDDFNEYFFAFITSSNIKVEGCTFRGLTTGTSTVNAGEQGIACLSCDGFYVIRNHFYDIGDAAVRSTDKVGGTPQTSFNTWIEDNVFTNFAQITTTPASGAPNSNSGTSNIHLKNNRMINQKWSTKMCTRGPSSGIFLIGNNISGNTSATYLSVATQAAGHGTTSVSNTNQGLEFCSVSNVQATDNFITNIGNTNPAAGAGITQYTNPGSSLPHFDYGNYNIHDNIIINANYGIVFSANLYADGGNPNVKAINIHHNTIRDIRQGGQPSMIILNGAGGFVGSAVKDNIMINPTSGSYMSLPASGVSSAGNIQN